MNTLKRIGVKNFHPRLYKAAPVISTTFSIEKTLDEHIWIQLGRIVFTTQPKGDGLYDDFWNYWDKLTEPFFSRSKKK